MASRTRSRNVTRVRRRHLGAVVVGTALALAAVPAAVAEADADDGANPAANAAASQPAARTARGADSPAKSVQQCPIVMRNVTVGQVNSIPKAGAGQPRAVDRRRPAAAPHESTLTWSAVDPEVRSRPEPGAAVATATATAASSPVLPTVVWTPGSVISFFISDGTAAHPDAGLLIGNGYSFGPGTCAGSAPCDGGRGGLLFGNGGNGSDGAFAIYDRHRSPALAGDQWRQRWQCGAFRERWQRRERRQRLRVGGFGRSRRRPRRRRR